MVETFAKTLKKAAEDSGRYNMGFAYRLPEGENILTVDSVTAAASDVMEGVVIEDVGPLVVGGATSSEQTVQIEISGGDSGVVYSIDVQVTGELGTVREGTGYLFVE